MWLIKIMSLAGVAAVAWVLCQAMGQRLVGQLVVIIALFACVSLTAEAVKPVVDGAKAKAEEVKKIYDETNEKLERVEKTYEEVDKKIEWVDKRYQDLSNRTKRFLWGKDRENKRKGEN